MITDNFICFQCKHFRPIVGGCDAFPDGIPYEIAELGESHDKPRPEQENDIVFEKMTEKERQKMFE